MGCIPSKDPRRQILIAANITFRQINKSNSGFITKSEIEKHFGSYSVVSTKILMRQIDLNKDEKISSNEWLGYWQLVRRAGYTNKQIIGELKAIQDGFLTLNFPKTYIYEQSRPRSVVIDNIIDEIGKVKNLSNSNAQ